MNQQIYEQLEAEFSKHKIEEDVDDVLLEMAEILAEKGIYGQEISQKEKWGENDTAVTAGGICSQDEDEEDCSVYLKWIKVGDKEFPIEEYLM